MQKLLINNSFSVNFPFQEKIRREANNFEDALKQDYPSIQTLPIPDNMDPRMPRIVLDSRHGFSQLLISQTSISLNILHYSDDYQSNITKGKKYLEERIGQIFELLEIAKIEKPSCAGLTSTIHIASHQEDSTLIKKIANCFKMDLCNEDLNELDIKRTHIIENTFFSNIRVHNFRAWQLSEPLNDQPRFKISTATTHGIEIMGDFNDRWKFNEDLAYSTDLKVAKEILNKGFEEIDTFSSQLTGK